MNNIQNNPYGPRRLSRDYVQHRLPKDRDEILRRIKKKGGAISVATWEEMEIVWLEGQASNDDFEEWSTRLMDNTEEPLPPTPELPDDLSPPHVEHWGTAILIASGG